MRRPREILTRGPVTLRRWRAGDEDAVYRAVAQSRDHLRPWMAWAADYSPAGAADFVRQSEQDWESGIAFNYAITLPGDAAAEMAAEVDGSRGLEVDGSRGLEVAGSCGLMARIGPGGLEIGYWVHGAHARRGLATAAAAALTAEAFTLPGIDRVEIVHDERNVVSGRIPRSLGFTEIGRRPHSPDGTAARGDVADVADVADVVWRLTRPG